MQVRINSMNIFGNGDFKIDKSWQRAPSRDSRNSSRKRSLSKQNNSFVNAAKRIMEPQPDILDSQMAKQIYKQFKAEIPPLPNSCRSQKKIAGNKQASFKHLPPRQKTNNDSDDLLTSMAARLKKVEENSQNQKKELKEKSDLIEKLKKENLFLKGMREDSEGAFKKYEELEKKNEVLQDKVNKMEEYLKKYGMKWVGNGKIEGQLNQKKMKQDISNSKNNYRLPSEIDLATIQRRVEELNAGLHHEGQGTQIYSQNGIHKMRKAEPLPMAFYGDGIAIKGFNFYPYKSKESLKILSDLVDGYFPYVLKGKYPNGVFLHVVDMIAQKYGNQENSERVASIDSMGKNDFKAPSKEQFLKKLPKQVIKNGKIIPIRAAISKKLDGIEQKKQQQNYQGVCLEIDGCLVFNTQTHKSLESGDVSENQICALKIRTEDGKIFILQLQSNATFKQVYSWMGKVISKKFKLMGNYPKREYEKTETNNLDELGLTPNAILHIQSAN